MRRSRASKLHLASNRHDLRAFEPLQEQAARQASRTRSDPRLVAAIDLGVSTPSESDRRVYMEICLQFRSEWITDAEFAGGDPAGIRRDQTSVSDSRPSIAAVPRPPGWNRSRAQSIAVERRIRADQRRDGGSVPQVEKRHSIAAVADDPAGEAGSSWRRQEQLARQRIWPRIGVEATHCPLRRTPWCVRCSLGWTRPPRCDGTDAPPIASRRHAPCSAASRR